LIVKWIDELIRGDVIDYLPYAKSIELPANQVSRTEVEDVSSFLDIALNTTPQTGLTTPVVIACDGACSGNPGPGGWGAVIQYPNGGEVELGNRGPATTNNRMELTALIEVLKAIKPEHSNNSIAVLADSQYVINCAQGNWKRKSNQDLWAEYDQVASDRNITFEWVRGHSGHELNERVDAIAVQHRDLASQGIESSVTPAVRTPVAQPQSAPNPVSQAQEEEVDNGVEAVTTPSNLTYPCYISYINQQLESHQTWTDCES
jgi:ribonuclease HI